MEEKPPRPKALKNMLVGKTRNDNMNLRTLSKSVYHTEKEIQTVIKQLIAEGRIKRLV